MNLSPVQESIVATKGNLVVRASAGTGKTHTMVSKIVKEIGNNKTHRVIAAITFTIKAAQEIKDRISVDVSRHFVGTNNSFVIEEVIKPFMKDVFGAEFDKELNTDYSIKVNNFNEGLDKARNESILCSYRENKKNFIFELALEIVKRSRACQLYLKSKYFKIYIDEYQDCDQHMHTFFMFICNNLNIKTFVVGDEKQSIYIWRGAYPEAFKSIWRMDNYEKIFMGDNFRSCQQIQNYSNLLFEETRNRYTVVSALGNIVWVVTSSTTWQLDILQHIDVSKKLALLRYSRDNAKSGAQQLTQTGVECVYIPPLPIADITTEAAWLYASIAKFVILDHYSVYDLISEIPVEGEESKRKVAKIDKYLRDIFSSKDESDAFKNQVTKLAEYLGYATKVEHIEKLFQTISDSRYHVVFESEKYRNISITFHSSKGLEFDQVIIFADDYSLSDMVSVYNHYVAVTRAKYKLIIVRLNNSNADSFERNLTAILGKSGIGIEDIVEIHE